MFGATIAVLLAVAGLPLGLSLAQVGPTVQIINPHPGTSIEISDKGQPYDLNSWVNVVPPSPLIEYELDVTSCTQGGNDVTTSRTIGTATQQGNAFSFKWDVEDDIADSSPRNPPTGPCLQASSRYELRAILYTGFTGPGTGVEVARDEMPVEINHLGSDAGETVEMTYPVNGGPLGVYIRQDGSGGNFTINATTSAQTGFVTPFYTISEFGEEPVWKSCGGYTSTQTEGGNTTVRLRCSTNAGDYALDVTGVAVVSNDTPPDVADINGPDPSFDDAGDAHAVSPYFQRVNTVTLAPETTSGQARAQCVQYVATAMDQNSRPIGNVNIDVMAQGPTDQLKFDGYQGSSGRVSDAMQVPNKNHPGNGETAISCQSGNRQTTAAGRQGDHNVAGGDDMKHIESVGGTDTGGEFEFALATDADGTTQLLAYADENDDDLFCSSEKSDSASIGWNVNAPSPSGFPSEGSSCEVATPPNSPTPSESGSTSPSSSGTGGGKDRHDRDITINFAHGSLIVSGKVSVDGGPNKCRSDVTVQVQRRVNKKWRTKKTVRTNGSGNYSATLRDKQGRYRARAPKETLGNDVCLLATAVKRHDH